MLSEIKTYAVETLSGVGFNHLVTFERKNRYKQGALFVNGIGINYGLLFPVPGYLILTINRKE
jgi:hypothetical protein